MNIFDQLFVYPITNILVAIYTLLTAIHIPYALGYSIIVLTIIIKLILYPFAAAQIRSAHKMQKISPHLATIREKHKSDNKRQQEEMMKLYKEHGVNPLGGCLPLIIQFPIIIGLYNVLNTAIVVNSVAIINKILYFDFLHLDTIWNTTFYGIPLTKTPLAIFSLMPVVAIAIPVIIAATQFILSKMMTPAEAPVTPKKDDLQSAMQMQTLYVLPVIFGMLALNFPIGLSLYWITFTVFGILQQYQLVGYGGLAPWIARVRKK